MDHLQLSLFQDITLLHADLFQGDLTIHLYRAILGLRPANERWGYFAKTSLIGWVEA